MASNFDLQIFLFVFGWMPGPDCLVLAIALVGRGNRILLPCGKGLAGLCANIVQPLVYWPCPILNCATGWSNFKKSSQFPPSRLQISIMIAPKPSMESHEKGPPNSSPGKKSVIAVPPCGWFQKSNSETQGWQPNRKPGIGTNTDESGTRIGKQEHWIENQGSRTKDRW